MWKKGTGEEEPSTGIPRGSFTIAPSIVHSASTLEDVRIPGSIVGAPGNLNIDLLAEDL